MRKRRFAWFCLALSISFFASGCFGRTELEEISLVTLIGIDKGQKEKVLVTAVIAIPRKARPSGGGGGGGGGGGSGGGESRLVISAEGKDITGALDNIDIMSSRIVTTMHTQMVIIGEDLAKDDVAPIADVFTRNLDFRHNTLIAVCQGKASDFLRKMSFPEETEPSAYLVELVSSTFRDMGTCPLITAHEFIIGYDTLESEPWAPYLSLASPETAEEKGKTKEGQEKDPNKDGGEESGDQKSKTKAPTLVTVKGSCVFRKVGDAQKMVGTLDLFQTMAVNMMRSTFQLGSIEISMPGDAEKTTTIAMHHFSSSSSVRIDQGKPKVKFAIRVTASLEETLSKHVDITPEIHKVLVFTIQDEIRSLLQKTLEHLKALGSDVVDLGMRAHKNFLTWQEWEKYNWPEKFKEVEAEFDVKVHLFTSGFTLSPPVPR